MAEENPNKDQMSSDEQSTPDEWPYPREIAEAPVDEVPDMYSQVHSLKMEDGEPADDDWAFEEPTDETEDRVGSEMITPDEETAQAREEPKTPTRAPRDSDEDKDFWDRSPWMGGLILILLGAIFLLRNINVLNINNWWAVFILIPALGSLSSAWRAFKDAGRFTTGVSSSLVGGLMMLVVALVFLLNLDWAYIWPVFLIIIGLGALAGGLARK